MRPKPHATDLDRWCLIVSNAGIQIRAWGGDDNLAAAGEACGVCDLRPGAGAARVDAADGSAMLAFDLDGRARVDDPAKANTGTGSPPYSDLGAWERAP